MKYREKSRRRTKRDKEIRREEWERERDGGGREGEREVSLLTVWSLYRRIHVLGTTKLRKKKSPLASRL